MEICFFSSSDKLYWLGKKPRLKKNRLIIGYSINNKVSIILEKVLSLFKNIYIYWYWRPVKTMPIGKTFNFSFF